MRRPSHPGVGGDNNRADNTASSWAGKLRRARSRVNCDRAFPVLLPWPSGCARLLLLINAIGAQLGGSLCGARRAEGQASGRGRVENTLADHQERAGTKRSAVGDQGHAARAKPVARTSLGSLTLRVSRASLAVGADPFSRGAFRARTDL